MKTLDGSVSWSEAVAQWLNTRLTTLRSRVQILPLGNRKWWQSKLSQL